jgi:hypothetical protein
MRRTLLLLVLLLIIAIPQTGFVQNVGYSGGSHGGSSASIDTNTALGTSDTVAPSQNAVKVYVDTPNIISGTGLTAGYAYYVNSSGVLIGANASASTTLPSPAICVASSATVCQKSGKWSTTGLTPGAVFYVPAITGGGTLWASAPSTTGQQVQIVGVASASTVLEIIISPVIVGL